VAIYYAILRGEESRGVAKKYGISHPSAVKYANEAIEALRGMPDISSVPLLRAFLENSLRMQTFAYEPALDQHIYPVLRPYIEQAAQLGTKPKEGADYMLSARVTEATYSDFQKIVMQIAQERPEISTGGHLREVIESYVAKGIIPAPEVTIEHGATPKLLDELTAEIAAILRRNGVQV
jgi:hypothetical protein